MSSSITAYQFNLSSRAFVQELQVDENVEWTADEELMPVGETAPVSFDANIKYVWFGNHFRPIEHYPTSLCYTFIEPSDTSYLWNGSDWVAP